MIGQEKVQKLKQLKEECLQCTKCGICATKADGKYDRHIFGVGNVNANILICAQNGGRTELLGKKPLIGKSGALTNKVIEFIGLTRSDVYITNIVKGYTDGNRTPSNEEANKCLIFLKRELSIIQPKLIITFGGVSLRSLVGCPISVTSAQNKFTTTNARIGNYVIYPMLHPSATFRKAEFKNDFEEGRDKLKEIVEGDFKKVDEYLQMS